MLRLAFAAAQIAECYEKRVADSVNVYDNDVILTQPERELSRIELRRRAHHELRILRNHDLF